MASPLSTQLVDDLKQNFYWSYISQDEENLEVVNLEMTVAQFLEYIDIDLDGDPYNPEDLVTLYYGMNEKVSDPGVNYFTYLAVNSVIEMGVMVNLGIIDHPTEFLLLEEDGDYSAVNNATYLTRKGMYESASIFSPYTDETTVIGSFTNHPLMCSFPKEDFKNFIVDNMSSPTMDLSTLKLVFQFGATFHTGVNPDYKVETAIVITKDISGLRLDGINYMDKPFKFKAMDVGAICPPQCGN
jgi:hypothetical protein